MYGLKMITRIIVVIILQCIQVLNKVISGQGVQLKVGFKFGK